MSTNLIERKENQTAIMFRLAYGLFLLLVVYLLVRGEIEDACINMGIALIFDPFNPKTKWADRPLYQRVWLLTHLGLTVAGFFYLIIR